jgi:hypothetical protein
MRPTPQAAPGSPRPRDTDLHDSGPYPAAGSTPHKEVP